MSIPKVCQCGRRALPGSSRCALHPIQAPLVNEAERLERQPYRRHYSSAEYRRNRVIAYRRDQGSCRQCGGDVHVGVDNCDHIVPLADGGSDELGNLMWLCVRCHKAKTKDDRRRRAERRHSGRSR